MIEFFQQRGKIPNMKLRRLLSIPIISVFIVLGLVYCATLFIFVEDWLGLQSSAGSLNALIFSLLGSLCVFSFLVSVLSDPGGVPSSYLPDVEENGSSDQEIKRNGVNQRLCGTCCVHKPPRAHHCRVCRRCILKMDHHCIWINNCVGHRNYKSFLVLVFYAFVATTYSAVIFTICTLQKDWDSSGSLRLKNFYVCYGIIISCLSFVLGSLFCWHIYLATHNLTTIEYHEGKRATWLARKSGLIYHHPFHVGAYRNLTLVLGPNILNWLWPVANSHLKDGLSFPTSRDNF